MSLRAIAFPSGSHGNFLSLVLNCLYSDDDSYQVLGQAFDSIHYQNLDIKFPHAHSRTYDDIGIIIDNELLWLHQLLCRTTDKNHHINDYENNFIELSRNHPGLRCVIDDFISMNRSIYPMYNKKKLKWFYQNKIFGKILSNEPSQQNKNYRYTIPFSCFYDLDQFKSQINKIIPLKKSSQFRMLEKLYGHLHQNLIHTDKNIHETGSILFESWQEYVFNPNL